MALLEVKDFSFSYENKKILENINFNIEEGEFVLMAGPSGSGKTTLLNNIKKELKNMGNSEGQILFNNKKIEDIPPRQSACDIGLMFQNPDNQIVTDTVIQEIAFPLENIGLPTNEIRNRISEMTAFFGLNNILYKNVNNLSGGQKQLVNLCSLLVLQPKLLLLDEPTSQLDPIASYEFLSILRRLNEEFSITILITEHKLDNIFPFTDKLIYLKDSKIKFYGKTRVVCHEIKDDETFKHYMPEVTKINLLINDKIKTNEPLALSVREGMKLLNKHEKELMKNYKEIESENENIKTEEILKIKNTWYGYEKNNTILRDIKLNVHKGEFISIIGGNGCGKSTLLKLIAGILKPVKGSVKTKKNTKISYIHQNPIIQFTEDTVEEELSLKRKNKLETDIWKSKQKKENDEKISLSKKTMDLVKYFNIENLLKHHPYDCSGGEKQIIAFIKAYMEDNDIIILDEPTKGLDPILNQKLTIKLKELHEKGKTIIMTTHDLTFVAENSHRCLMIFDGTILLDETPTNIFSRNNFYTTFVNRMVKKQLPQAITIDNVKEQWQL